MPESNAMIGQTIAGCRIVEKLGEGGMGAVYKAEEVSLQRTVALKVLRRQVAEADPEYVERFIQEAQSAAQLDHPHTVTVYGAGEEDGRYYIKMQFVEGRSLEDVLKERAKLNVCEAVELIRGAARGLAAAHEANVLHRDVKPSNIMVSDKGSRLRRTF